MSGSPREKITKAGIWTNFILCNSNLVAFGIIYIATINNQPFTALIFLNSMISSMIFHFLEQHKHPELPGFFKISARVEHILLQWDRISAILAFLVILHYNHPYYILNTISFSIGLICNIISELQYFGIVKNSNWNKYIYPITHSLWHIFVFIGSMVILGSRFFNDYKMVLNRFDITFFYKIIISPYYMVNWGFNNYSKLINWI